MKGSAGEKKKQGIPEPSRWRLVQLARFLDQLGSCPDAKVITSAEIENQTGLSSLSIRRDISLLGISCASSAGYNIAALKESIGSILGISTAEKKCCIVGLGQLGAALAQWNGLSGTSFRIAAGFDSNINRTEILKTSFPLYSTARMETVIARENIVYAVLAVPERSAQETASKLVQCGIRGIVNFTAAVLNVPAGVLVRNLSIIDALENLAASEHV